MARPTGFTNGFSSAFGAYNSTFEIMLSTRDYPGAISYRDGDIIQTFSNINIRHANAQVIIKPKFGGFMPTEFLYQKYLERVFTYKLQRTGRHTAIRTHLVTLQEDDVSTQMNVDEYFSRRLAASKAPLFGTVGAELAYGGRRPVSHADIDGVWDDIENDTGILESDHLRWPASQRELKNHLFLSVNSFTDLDARDMMEQDIDESDPELPFVVRKRLRRFNWKDIRNMNVDQVKNRNLETDIRGDKHIRQTFIETK